MNLRLLPTLLVLVLTCSLNAGYSLNIDSITISVENSSGNPVKDVQFSVGGLYRMLDSVPDCFYSHIWSNRIPFFCISDHSTTIEMFKTDPMGSVFISNKKFFSVHPLKFNFRLRVEFAGSGPVPNCGFNHFHNVSTGMMTTDRVMYFNQKMLKDLKNKTIYCVLD